MSVTDKAKVTTAAFVTPSSVMLISEVGVYGASFGMILNTYETAMPPIVPRSTPDVFFAIVEKNTVKEIVKAPNSHQARMGAARFVMIELSQK